MRMIHHASLPVANLGSSSSFYDAVLAALGYHQVCTSSGFIGYGTDENMDQFSIMQINPSSAAGICSHLAFSAPSREAVNLFYAAGLEFGGTCNGLPGLRKHYGPDYYAAFIIDLDGHRLEAVTNKPICV